tara:strand:+ start:3655 stop:4236 length:582 start_codon:yes stop_codon:yes gene_type:complete
MKRFFILFTFFSSLCSAYNLSYVGEIKLKEYNDVWEEWFDEDLTIYAGSDGEQSTVRLKFDMTLGEYDLDYSFWGTDISEVSSYMNLLNHLKKGQDWTKIAKENAAETNKEIGWCSTSSTICKVSFISSNNARNTNVMLYVKENDEWSWNEANYKINDSNDLANLIGMLDPNRINRIINESIRKNNQADDLFN